MIYAIYRCLYGEDFIIDSINSIDSFVDKIFIFYDDIPWGNVTSVKYKNEVITFPKKFDNIIENILSLNNPKVHLQKDHVYNNRNQFTHFVNDLILPNFQKPDYFLIIEVDHVFQPKQFLDGFEEFQKRDIFTASFVPLELWKTPSWMIPIRDRVSSIFWKMRDIQKLPETGRQGNVERIPKISQHVHNFGFCFSEQTMYWKHLLALAYAEKIGDSTANEDWLERKWLSWDPQTNNENLEMSTGYEHLIPYAIPYDEEKYGPIPELKHITNQRGN